MMKAHPSDKLVQLKSLETLGKVADGKGNKVFIPFEATKSLASLGAMKEVIKDDEVTDAQVDNSTPSKPSDTDNDN